MTSIASGIQLFAHAVNRHLVVVEQRVSAVGGRAQIGEADPAVHAGNVAQRRRRRARQQATGTGGRVKRGSSVALRRVSLIAVSPSCSFPTRRIELKGRRACATPLMLSLLGDRDTFDRRTSLLGLRQRDRPHAVAERGFRLVLLDAIQRNLPLEGAVVALREEFSVAIPLGLLLALSVSTPLAISICTSFRSCREVRRR